jgi:tRNA dimethylallyltransferase
MVETTNPLENMLAIVGPTASGKSNLSIALFEAAQKKGLTLEIISMDSALVYKGMNIGTAKPTRDELLQIPHHGIDIREPWESYSAATFAQDVKFWAQDIRSRGNYPVIVGGTMLYWRSLMQGLTDLPPSTQEVRAKIALMATQQGWDAVYLELVKVDPVTAARLPPGDTQRVSRALEVFAMTGKPMSDFLEKDPYASSRDEAQFKHLLVSLEPSNRAWLHDRIERRFQQILDLGLVEEVKTLLNHPMVTQELPAMRAVGYRQAASYLQDECSYSEFVNAGIAASRQLAKRQLTWLRAMPSRQIIDPSSSNFIADAVNQCLQYISQVK